MRKFTRVWWGLPLVVVASGVLGAGCGGSGEGSDKAGSATPTGRVVEEVKTDFGVTDTEIRLGQHVDGSGNKAKAYENLVPALQAYFAYVNDQGGVCDRALRLINEDDRDSSVVALQKAQKLVENDEVAAFIGNAGAQANAGSAAYINDQGVPDLFIAGADPVASQEEMPWTVVFDPDPGLDGRTLAAYLNEKLPEKPAGVLYATDDSAKAARDRFVEVFKADIVAEQAFEPGANIDGQLARLRGASPTPEIIYVSAPVASASQVLSYLAANPDWKPWVVIGDAASPTALAVTLGGDGGAKAGYKLMAGAITSRYLLDPLTDKKNPAFVEHARYMKEFKGPAVSAHTLYAQALGESAVQTLEIACENGDLTREGIMEAAESIEGFHPSPLVEEIDITLGEDDHKAIELLQPVQIQANGELKALTEGPVNEEGDGE